MSEYEMTDGPNQADVTAPDEYTMVDKVPLAPPMPDRLAQSRAAKAHFGLGEDSPGEDVLLDAISKNKDNIPRQEAALKEDRKYQERKLSLIQKVAGKKGAPLNEAETDYILSAAHDIQHDPDTIFESKFIRNWTTSAVIDRPEENRVFAQAFKDNPEAVTDWIQIATDLGTRNEIFKRVTEDTELRWKNTPFFSVNGEEGQLDQFNSYIRGLVPGLGWYTLYNAVAGAPTQNYFIGNNMEEQVKHLWSMPIEEAKAKFQKTVDDLFKTDPLMAVKFAHAVNSYGTNDKFIDNVLISGGDIATVAPMLRGVASVGARAVINRFRKPPIEPGPLSATPLPGAGKAPVQPSTGLPEGVTQGDLFPGLERSVRPEQLSLPLGETRKPSAPAGEQLSLDLKVMPDIQTELPMPLPFETRLDQLPAGMTKDISKPKMLTRDQTGRFVKVREPEQLQLPLAERTNKESAARFDRTPSGGQMELPFPSPEARKALADIVKSTSGRVLDAQDSLTIIGDTKAAAIIGAKQNIETELLRPSMDPLDNAVHIAKNLPTIYSPGTFYDQSNSLSKEATRRLTENAKSQVEKVLGNTESPVRISRLNDVQLREALSAATERQKKDHINMNDAWLDTEPAYLHTKADNVSYGLFRYGKPDASLFVSPEQAEHWARQEYRLPAGAYDIRSQGTSFYIEIARPLDETASGVRAAAVVTEHSRTPQSMASALLGYLRSSQDLTTYLNTSARHIATHASSPVRKVFKELAEETGRAKLSKDEYTRLTQVIEEARIKENPATGTHGVYYDTAADLENAYVRLHSRLPTENEISAYDTFRRINDWDYMMRELGWYRDMSRLGVENQKFTIKAVTKEGATEVNESPWFKGKVVDKLPWAAREDAAVWMYDATKGEKNFFWKFDRKVDKEAIEKEITDGGYKVIQVFAPLDKPLKDITGVDDVIHFVVANNRESKRLRWGEASDYTPGSHFVYQDQWFVKQPKIAVGHGGKQTYYGDATLRSFPTEARAKEYASRYDTARRLMLAGDDTALETYLGKNLPESLAEFKKLFTGAGPLSGEHPITHTYTGRDVFETHSSLRQLPEYVDMRDATHAAYNLTYALDKKFIAERGQILNTVKQSGTEANPIFNLIPAPLLDPWVSTNRAVGNAIRARWMNDYKFMSSEQWIREFQDVLDAPLSTTSQNPLYYLYHAPFKEQTVERERLMAAKLARTGILNFVGAQSELGANIARVEQKLLNSVSSYAGDGAAEYLTNSRVLSAIKDPAGYVRATGFHTKLGLLNPVQFFVQASVITHAFELSPTQALQGNAAAVMMRRLLHTDNPAIIERYASISKMFGWKPEDFKEAYQWMKNSGIHNVGGEVTVRDDVFDPRLFEGVSGKFLDKGTFFFTEGERMGRLTAFNTAYREWRAANSGKVMNDREMVSIMNRADNMTVNMTRASNASWQNGLLTIPTQFWSFNLRLAEQMLGTRLTKMEKLRVLGINAALYGIPVAASIPTGVYSAYDDIKRAAWERGINVSQGFYKILHDGLINFAQSLLTGEDYDIATRFGPAPADNVAKALNGDSTFQEVILGASGKVIGDLVSSVSPFYNYARSAFKGDSADIGYRMTMEDMLGVAKNISSVSNATKLIYGMNWGKYVSKNNIYLGDVTTQDSVFMGLLGVTPMHIKDAMIRNTGMKIQDEDIKIIENEVRGEYTKAMRAFTTGDDALGNKYLARSKFLLDGASLPVADRQRIEKNVTQSVQSLEERINQKWLEKAPPEQYINRQNMFLENKGR